jgi:hypothetical protein
MFSLFLVLSQILLAWVNKHLKKRNLQMNNLQTDFQNGVLLINLLEIVSGQKVKKYFEKPTRIFQYLENLEIALKFLSYLQINVKAEPQGTLLIDNSHLFVSFKLTCCFVLIRHLQWKVEYNCGNFVFDHFKVQRWSKETEIRASGYHCKKTQRQRSTFDS